MLTAIRRASSLVEQLGGRIAGPAPPHNRHTPAYSEPDMFMRAVGFAEMSD
jgi:hypothetical protein